MAITVERIITVPGTSDQVMAYVADFSNTEEWDPGIVAASRTSDGPVIVGSTFHLVARFGGRDLDTRYRVTEHEPGERILLVGGTSNFTSTDVITATDVADGVRVVYRATFGLSGIMRFAEPFLKGSFNRLADDAVAGLKRVLST
jgi:hypothetical protein